MMQISSNPTVSKLWELLSQDSQEFWIDSAILVEDDQLWIQCPAIKVMHLAKPCMRKTPFTDMHESAVIVGVNSILIHAQDCNIRSTFRPCRKWNIKTKVKNV